MIVVVVDQAGAVVKDAKVSVVNTATGAAREAASGSYGSATFSALSLTGTYTVTVSREGDDLRRSPNFWNFNKFRATRYLTEIYDSSRCYS